MFMPDQEEEIEVNQVHAEDVRGRVARLERLKDHFWRTEVSTRVKKFQQT